MITTGVALPPAADGFLRAAIAHTDNPYLTWALEVLLNAANENSAVITVALFVVLVVGVRETVRRGWWGQPNECRDGAIGIRATNALLKTKRVTVQWNAVKVTIPAKRKDE